MELDQVIELEGVDIFQKEALVLNDVNFRVDKGEFVYLIGKTGSGKSSLLKAIYAEVPVKQGKARVVGYDLTNLRNREVPLLRRKLGIVFQDFQLLTDRSVYENLHFVLKATGWKNKQEITERIQDVLNKVDLGTKGHKMPHQLSGGEQQRVSIARALLNDPEIVIADEPTGNLDPDTSRGIMSLLFEIKQTGRAVLMATHNYTLIREFPSRTLKCEEGRLTPSEDQLH